jgi:hypothetical protein
MELVWENKKPTKGSTSEICRYVQTNNYISDLKLASGRHGDRHQIKEKILWAHSVFEKHGALSCYEIL